MKNINEELLKRHAIRSAATGGGVAVKRETLVNVPERQV